MAPEFLWGAMQVLALWSNIDLIRARTLAHLMNADKRLTVAMYYAVVNDQTRADMLLAVAEAAVRYGYLSKSDHTLLKDCMAFADDTKTKRNAFAHGVFVRYETAPHLLCLAKPADLALNIANFHEWKEIERWLPPDASGEHDAKRRVRAFRRVQKRRIDMRFDNSKTMRLTGDDLLSVLSYARLVEATMSMLEHVIAKTPGKARQARRAIRGALEIWRTRKPLLMRRPQPPPVPQEKPEKLGPPSGG